MQSLKRVFTFRQIFASDGTLTRTGSVTSSALPASSLSVKYRNSAAPSHISSRSGILIPCALLLEIHGIIAYPPSWNPRQPRLLNSINRQPAFAVWITGLPASGKSTAAAALASKLSDLDIDVVVLESDALRKMFSSQAAYSQL